MAQPNCVYFLYVSDTFTLATQYRVHYTSMNNVETFLPACTPNSPTMSLTWLPIIEVCGILHSQAFGLWSLAVRKCGRGRSGIIHISYLSLTSWTASTTDTALWMLWPPALVPVFPCCSPLFHFRVLLFDEHWRTKEWRNPGNVAIKT